LQQCKKNYGLYGTIVYFVVYNLFKEKENKTIIVTLAIFGMLAINNWQVVTENYKMNEQIYYQNMARIEEFKKNGQQEGELVLLPPNDLKYGFTNLVGVDWVEKAVKEFFDINPNVNLIEESIK
jgi:hypothetical protein